MYSMTKTVLVTQYCMYFQKCKIYEFDYVLIHIIASVVQCSSFFS